MKVKLSVMDWPTVSAQRVRPEGWNLWPLSMGIEPYEGPYGVVGFFALPSPVQIKPDPVIEAAQAKLTGSLKVEDRQAAVRQFQARMYDQAISIKCGDIGIYQATRGNVVNYKQARAAKIGRPCRVRSMAAPAALGPTNAPAPHAMDITA